MMLFAKLCAIFTVFSELQRERSMRLEAERRLVSVQKVAELTIASLRDDLANCRAASWESELRAKAVAERDEPR